MSTIVRYSSGSTYTIVPNKVDIEKVQDLDGQYHIPNTSIVGMMRLGLGVQRITVSGDILDMSACLWHDVVAISFDSGTSYQTVYFAGVPYSSDCWSGIYPYALSLLASPLKEQTAVRYPTTGYKWGNQSITGISQAGNVNAFLTIHYLAPLFYAPLSNTLVDFAGQSITLTRTASKVHGGVTYPINVPIYDNGLYLASDTAPDVATWTPPASAVRTVAMQIKSRYPSPWLIGGGGVNLLTANQSNAETNTTGMQSDSGTFTRNTSTPLVGTGDFKVVAATGTYGILSLATASQVSVTAGHWYCAQAIVKTTCAAGRGFSFKIYWSDVGNGDLGYSASSVVVAPTVATVISIIALAPATAVKALIYMFIGSGCAAGETLYADSLMMEAIPQQLFIWHATKNTVWIDTYGNTINWTDGAAAVFLALPAAYMSGTVMNVTLLDATSHAVTITVAPFSGAWTSVTGTLAALTWPQLTLGNLEGSIANLIEYPYVLADTEYQALAYSSMSLLFNTLYIGNRYAGEIIKGSDKRLLNANGSDISALLGGVDIPIGSAAVTIAQSQGVSARWYVEVKRTDV